MNRTFPRTLPAHCKDEPRTFPAHCKNKTPLKALARKLLRPPLQCANVRALMSAQPHITPESRTFPRTFPAHCTPHTLQKAVDPGRTWEPENPFVCECGFPTGWLRDGKPLCPECDGKQKPGPKTQTRIGHPRAQISPVALSWLAKNKFHLKAAGWTMAELYRRNLSKGIAWVGAWDMPGLAVTIEGSGCISLYFLTATGQKIKQTAWPKKHHRKRSIKR